MSARWSRRAFLGTAGLAGAGALLGLHSRSEAAEPPPETTRLRLLKTGSICWAPQYIADAMLKAEGFTQIDYIDMPSGAVSVRLASGEADMSLNFVGPNILRIEAGDPVVFLAGIHVGCFEVVATEAIQRIRDLKGKTVAIASINGAEHVFLASIAAHVGLDPRQDIRWLAPESMRDAKNEGAMRLFLERKADAFLGFPPQPQELRARKVGRVIVNSATDRPWSQYFCCLLTASKEFVRSNPIATRRALRAILKSTDACAADPEGAARTLVDKGYTPHYETALQVMKELPFNKWREYDPEDTVRFYALRLHEAGMIKSSPQRIIAQGSDWRFVRQLKREMKS
jgi:NitT/TauT family transport system substrate-binding protein